MAELFCHCLKIYGTGVYVGTEVGVGVTILTAMIIVEPAVAEHFHLRSYLTNNRFNCGVKF